MDEGFSFKAHDNSVSVAVALAPTLGVRGPLIRAWSELLTSAPPAAEPSFHRILPLEPAYLSACLLAFFSHPPIIEPPSF